MPQDTASPLGAWYTATRLAFSVLLLLERGGCALSLGALLLVGCASSPALPLRVAGRVLHADGVGPCSDDPGATVELDPARPLAVLVHGCHSSSGRMRVLATALTRVGQQTVCYRYDDRDSIRESGDRLRRALQTLESSLADKQILLIGHSQGGLVARAALEVAHGSKTPLRAGYRLTTVSSPFGGVGAARVCGSRALRVLSLGFTAAICHMISGSNWNELHPSSTAVRAPRSLDPAVRRHLLIATDERGSCRTVGATTGTCAEDDFVFPVQEQHNALIERDERVRVSELAAGHAEVVGETGELPLKLVDSLLRHGLLAAPEARTLSAAVGEVTR